MLELVKHEAVEVFRGDLKADGLSVVNSILEIFDIGSATDPDEILNSVVVSAHEAFGRNR